MYTFLRNYWCLYLDFIDKFKDIAINGIPIPLLISINRYLDYSMRVEISNPSFCRFCKNKISSENQVQSIFDRYVESLKKKLKRQVNLDIY